MRLIGKNLLSALLASVCCLAFGDDVSLRKEAQEIVRKAHRSREGSAEYNAACIEAAEKYLEAVKEARNKHWKSQYYVEACILFKKAGAGERVAKTAEEGAEISDDMRLLHSFALARAGRMDELYRIGEETYRESPSGSRSHYWLGTMFIAAVNDPKRLEEAVRLAESKRIRPASIFYFGTAINPGIFDRAYKKEWRKLLLPAMSRAPFTKFAAEAREQCLIVEVEDLDVKAAERLLAANPESRLPLLEKMAEKYCAVKDYRSAENAYREIADLYHKKAKEQGRQTPNNDAFSEFQARRNMLRAMISGGRRGAAVKEADAMFPACRSDTERMILADNLKDWAYEEKSFDLSLKYAELYREYVVKEWKSYNHSRKSEAQIKKERDAIERKAISAIYRAYAALDRQKELFRALDEFAEHADKDDPTADYEKGMFLIRHRKLSEARKYLDSLEARSRRSSGSRYRYNLLKRALEKAEQ